MSKSLFLRTVLLCCFLTGSGNVFAGNVGVTLPHGTSVHLLDNGLKVLLIENRLLPMVGVNVIIKTGSAYETFATSGMSHMLEHLLFNGTLTRNQKQLYDDVDMIGGYNNANTSSYYTNFMMVTPAEHISQGMEIQADMLFNSTLPAEKFEKEKGIVLEEIAQSLARPMSQLERNTNDVLFSGHALSLPVLGTYTTIQSMVRDDVLNYYKNAYVPNNMVMSVVGNFRTDSMLIWIKNIYGKLKPADVRYDKQTAIATGFNMPQQNNGDKGKVFHRFYNGKEEQIQIFYSLTSSLSAAQNDLLSESLRLKRDALDDLLTAVPGNDFKSVELSVMQNPLYAYLQVSITTKGNTGESSLISSADNFIRKAKFSLPMETIELFATKSRTDFLKNLEKPHMFGIYNAESIAIEGIGGVFRAYEKSEYDHAGSWLKTLSINTEPVIILHHPAGSGVQSANDTQVVDQKFVDEKSGLKIISRQSQASELVAIHFLFGQKARLESEYGADAAKYLHDCFDQRLKNIENQKISQKFGLTVTANDNPYIPMDNIYLHPDFGYIRFEGLAFDLPGLIRFVTGQFNDFEPTQEEYDRASENFTRAGMMMARGDQEKVFNDLYESLVYEDALYGEPQTKITFDKLKEFADQYFTPSNLIISVVSSASPDSINKLLSASLNVSGSLRPTKPGYERALRPTLTSQKKESDGGGEQSYLFWGYVQQIEVTDVPALTALSLVLSDTIVFDVRERQGRAYRMSAGITPVNDRALFYVRMGTRPENIDPLVPQMAGFFSKKIVQDLSDNNLRRIINQYLGRMMFRRLSSINQAYYLANSEYFNGDMYSDQKLLENLKQINIDDIMRVAGKYLDPENSVSVIVR